jgi:8-oxo-dGTP pyrophosphatase MutT (NUDIX family)
MRWVVHGERWIYRSEWVGLSLVDVEIPDGPRFEHHVVRMPFDAAGAVVHDPARGLLLIWRHRFITDSWGWELPAGHLDAGETPEQTAARETLEETGWRPGPMLHLATFHPSNGTSDQRFHVFLAAGAEQVGAPTDPGEAERIEWVPLDEVRAILQRGEMPDGLSFGAVCYALAFARL